MAGFALFPAPTPEQAHALNVAGAYLDRAASQSQTRLMALGKPAHRGVAMTDVVENIQRSADVCHMLLELFSSDDGQAL